MYNPSDHKPQNIPFGMSDLPLNGKSLFLDKAKFKYRQFISVSECQAYFDDANAFFDENFKDPTFECIINTGGVLQSNGTILGGTNDAYWFRDSVTLVKKAGYSEQQINDFIAAINLALSNHINDTDNPHSVTAGQVGLGNVDNTSDEDKPISNETQTALDLKASAFGLESEISRATAAEQSKAEQIYVDLKDLEINNNLTAEIARATAAESSKANLSDVRAELRISYADLVANTYTNSLLANQVVSLSYEDENGAHVKQLTFNSSGVATMPSVVASNFVGWIGGASGILTNFISKIEIPQEVYSKFVRMPKSSGLEFAFLDALDGIYLSIDLQGRTRIAVYADNQIPISAMKQEVLNRLGVTLAESSGWEWAWLSKDDYVYFGSQTNGDFIGNGINLRILREDVDSLQESITPIENLEVLSHGDSLTEGAGGGGVTYSNVLQALLGSNYTVINNGVGGENVPTICARVGSLPMMLQTDVTIPAGASIEIGNDATPLKNVDGSDIFPLIQGAPSKINPVTIMGFTCTLTRTGTKGVDLSYKLSMTTPSLTGTLLRAKETVYTNSVKIHGPSNKKLGIIFIGQNGGYTGNDDLIRYIDSVINFYGHTKYVVIGLTSLSRAVRGSLETAMLKKYGNKYINMREYLTTYGLSDAGLTPTSDDTTAMASGIVPPQLQVDGLHFTATGYTLIGNKIYKVMQTLNYI